MYCSTSPLSRSHARSSRQSSRCSIVSATSSNWKSSMYQDFSRCSIVGSASARGCPTESTASRSTRSGANAASPHATAAPQSWPTTWARSISSASSTASMSATLWRSA